MAVCESLTGAGLQIAFELSGAPCVCERRIGDQAPGTIFMGVFAFASIVFGNTPFQIVGGADVAAGRMTNALEKIHIKHTVCARISRIVNQVARHP